LARNTQRLDRRDIPLAASLALGDYPSEGIHAAFSAIAQLRHCVKLAGQLIETWGPAETK
jgi:hypothetical protein